MVLTWDDPGDASIIGYAVVRWTLGYNATGFVTIAADTGTAATSYTDDTVEPKNEYLYHVKAIDAQGESEQSEWVRVTTPADPNPAPAEPPARPTGVVSAAASDLVLLSWADPGDDSVTGYRILRRGIADEADDFVTLAADTGTAETGYADDTVENGRVYVYRVLAIGPGGVSEPSQDLWVRTTVPVVPREPQRGLPSQGTPQPRQSVSEPAGEDCTAGPATTCRVAVDGSVTGNIVNNTDIDSFAVDLEAGHQYQIDLEGDDTSQGTLADPNIGGVYEVRDDGTFQYAGLPSETQDSDSGEGKNARLTFTADTTKTYYILAQGRPGQNVTGTYRLSVTAGKAGSGYGRYMPLEGRLQVGGTLSGTLGVPSNYGIFSYYFALEDLEVGRYTVDFGTGGIDSIHHFLTDRERSGTVDLEDTWIIVAQAHGRRSFTFDVRPGMEGTHYVLLSMRRNDTGDYAATLEKAMPHLRVGRTGVVGEVPADSDGFALHMEFFSVDLEAGQKYQVDIKGKHSADEECEDDDGNDEACTLDHTMLGNIQAPNGDYVGGDGNFDDTDDDIGGTVLHFYGGGDDRGNTRFTFTADQDGTHFLKVGGRLLRIEDGSGFRAGTFRLSVREVPGGRSPGRALNGVRATAGPNALSAARKTVAPPPLTARFAGVPDEHDGASPFALQVAFSSAIETGHRTLRDHSLSVSGGAATAARPVVAGQWDLWEIEVQPASDEAVQVSLPPTRACGDAGAVCSADGRALSNGLVTTVPGPATPRRLSGSAADDTLSGRAGDDVLRGGPGADTLHGGAGNDTLVGDDGDPEASAPGEGADLLDGEDGHDTLYGDGGADTLVGGDGDDVLYGGADGDTLVGGSGNDALYGDGGDDVLEGDGGDDTLTGGPGADTFVFAAGDGADTITDFFPEEGDQIDLSAFADLDGFASLTLTADDSATVLDLRAHGGGTVRLQGIAAADLLAADFLWPGACRGSNPP